MPPLLSPLPIDLSDFPEIRGEGALYVDKTASIAEMIGAAPVAYIAERLQGTGLSPQATAQYAALQARGFKYVFLARPRRFGKSLLVSTLESLFLGQESLFRETWIHQHGNWNWSPHPVLRLDLSARTLPTAASLRSALYRQVQVLCEHHKVPLPAADWRADELLDYLIRALVARERERVVVLVDEYDAPIGQNLEEPPKLKEILEILHPFYTVLKARDQDLRFAFITGVSRFARTSLFSAFNNLVDLSRQAAYSDICGFTESDLDQVLHPYIQLMATGREQTPEALRADIRHWYDGYLFAPDGNPVYNPFSTLRCLHFHTLDNYWIESGTSTMLYERIIRQPQYLPSAQGISVQVLDQELQDPLMPSTWTLMYDTGYLSLRPDDAGPVRIDFPNREVGLSFSRGLLQWQAQKIQEEEDAADTREQVPLLGDHMAAAFCEGRYESFGHAFNTYLRRFPFGMSPTASQPDTHTPSPGESQVGLPRKLLPSMELYYHALLYAFFVVQGMDVTAFAINEQGEADLAVRLPDRAVIIDFKIRRSPLVALHQIRERNYRSTFDRTGLPVESLGLTINPQQRQVTQWQVAPLGTSDQVSGTWHDPTVGDSLSPTNPGPKRSSGPDTSTATARAPSLE